MCLEDTVRIPLRARDGSIRTHVLIDAADAGWANQWTWRLDSKGYAKRGQRVDGVYLNIYLHRELLGLPRIADTRGVDHIDRNTLNCRRTNLRILTQAGNMQNQGSRRGATSNERGVCWDRRYGKWVAVLQVGGRQTWLGRFVDERDAIEAVRAARRALMPYAVD
jgi:hypothetical protein